MSVLSVSGECQVAGYPVVNLGPDLISKGSAMLRACGVVVVPGAVDALEALELRARLPTDYEYLFAKRRALRGELRRAMRYGLSLRELGARLVADNTSLLAFGDFYRERNDGRIDLPLAAALEFRAAPLVRAVMPDAVLRYSRAIVALGNVAADQHWHRDSIPLFDDEVYAVNCFVHLEDASRGATQFVLGSHRWSRDVWEEHEDDVEWSAPPLPPGTLVLADYRTVHRGVAVANEDRWLAMFVYARPWWVDPTNYQDADYGGFAIQTTQVDTTDLVHPSDPRHAMYWGLVNQWSPGLRQELRQELTPGVNEF